MPNLHKLVYVVNRYGGGIDGRDPSDKGGPCKAFFSEDQAMESLEHIWGGGSVNPPIVVHIPDAWSELLSKLSPVDLLLLRTYCDPKDRAAFEAETGYKLKGIEPIHQL